VAPSAALKICRASRSACFARRKGCKFFAAVVMGRSGNTKRKHIKTINRLFFDIETSPNVVYSWRLGYKVQLSPDNLLEERAVICIGYKWQNGKAAHSLVWNKAGDDKAMLLEFMDIAARADELVGHNGDKYDLPWLKTRCILHGIPTLPAYKTIDTLQWARRNFYFNSNRLDYIGKFLGFGGKKKTAFDLWKRVLKDDRKALAEMSAYCRRDVELLEDVYEKLAAHVPHKTHVGALTGGDKWTCPHCGGMNVKTAKKRCTAAGTIQWQMQCLDDGRFYAINDAQHSLYREAKKKDLKKAA
jgi:hypothetical protein